MPKNSINLIQVENTKEGIEKLADLLLVATENITYMQYKLSSQMFGGNSDVIEIRFGDCVEYVSRIIMEADAKRRDELLLRIAKITVCPAAACSVEAIFRNAVQKPVFAFSGRSSFQNICSDGRKKKEEKKGEKYPQIPASEKRVYCGDVCAGE